MGGQWNGQYYHEDLSAGELTDLLLKFCQGVHTPIVKVHWNHIRDNTETAQNSKLQNIWFLERRETVKDFLEGGFSNSGLNVFFLKIGNGPMKFKFKHLRCINMTWEEELWEISLASVSCRNLTSLFSIQLMTLLQHIHSKNKPKSLVSNSLWFEEALIIPHFLQCFLFYNTAVSQNICRKMWRWYQQIYYYMKCDNYFCKK